MSRLRTLDCGVTIIDGDTHLSKWVEERGKLDIDDNCNAAAERFLKPGDVVVDGGASLGDSTLAFLNKVGPTGRVLAFEPNPEAFEALQRNCPHAVIVNAALADNGGLSVLNPMLENVGMTWVDPKYSGSVLTIPLDVLHIERLKLLKLDVEGMELHAIVGADETISICRPIVLLELNDVTLARFKLTKQDVLSKMESLNYRMELCQAEFGLDNTQVDVLFLPK